MEKKNEAQEERAKRQKNVQRLTEASRLLSTARAKAFGAFCDLDREELNNRERLKAFNTAYDALADELSRALSFAFLLEADANEEGFLEG